MTIAAGFRCADGVILCADTQEVTQGFLKTRVPKLIIRPQGMIVREGIWTVFAGAGHGPLIDKLIDKAWSAVEGAVPFFEPVCNAIEEAIKSYHQELTTLFQSGDPDYPRAELIYGVSVKDDVGLFKATGPIVNPVPRYETAGSGEVLAKYIADVFTPIDGLLSVRQAAIISLYALQQTKEHAEGCGGDSHVVILQRSEDPKSLESPKVAGATYNLWNLEVIARRLFLAVPDLEMSEEEFSKELGTILTMIQGSRKQHQEFLRKFDESLFNTTKSKRSDAQK